MVMRRTFRDPSAASEAIYSDCGRYRYSLTRTWKPSGRRALYVMLNPSTATEVRNDPTVERCERRSRSAGFGAFRVCNIFAWRSTDPAELRIASDPVGPDNDAMISASCRWADWILCAWGNHGTILDRGAAAERLLREAGPTLHHFGITKQGHPRHPLYVSYTTRAKPWTHER